MSRLANDNRFFFCWKLVALAINDKQLQSKIEMMQMNGATQGCSIKVSKAGHPNCLCAFAKKPAS
jgi:hypothetical protein